MKWVARVALLVVATIVSAELLLQATALLVRDRSDTASEGEITILCVGDSHTYGTGMEAAKSYPGRLQAELDDVAPGRFRVVNRGVPGFTTWERRAIAVAAALLEHSTRRALQVPPAGSSHSDTTLSAWQTSGWPWRSDPLGTDGSGR